MSTEEVVKIPVEITMEIAIPEPVVEIITSENALFSKEIFLQKLINGGIKQNLIPLLRTADIDFHEETITIKTTSFAEGRCRESVHWRVIESIGYELGAKKVDIILLKNDGPESPKSESPTDIALEIFGE